MLGFPRNSARLVALLSGVWRWVGSAAMLVAIGLAAVAVDPEASLADNHSLGQVSIDGHPALQETCPRPVTGKAFRPGVCYAWKGLAVELWGDDTKNETFGGSTNMLVWAANQTPPTAGEVITEFVIAVEPAAGGNTPIRSGHGDIPPRVERSAEPDLQNAGDTQCKIFGPQRSLLDCPGLRGNSGFDLNAEWAVDSSEWQGGTSSVNVIFDNGAISPCIEGAADARVADNCTPPSHTRITDAKIKAKTALFRFKARLATSFWCELIRNNQVMFNRSCHSPKPYANPLPPGKYIFLVSGVNRGGMDSTAAVKKFTIR